MRRVTVDPAADPLWHELVQRRPSSVFHSPAWVGVLADTYGFNIRADVITDDAGPSSGILYAMLEDMMDPRIVSLPFSDFCDPLVGDEGQWKGLIDPLLEHGHRLTIRGLEVGFALDDGRFEETSRARWHAVDLLRETDDVWGSLHPSARRSIRKARAAGVTVREAESQSDLRSFFELHLGIRKYKYRLLAQPYRFFEAIWEAFIVPGNGALLLATSGDETLGGVLFLEWGDTLYYKFNASSPAHLAVRPNDIVVWAGIEYARQRELAKLDFGLSDADQEGLVRYKRKFSTDEREIHSLQYPGREPQSRTDEQIRSLLPVLTDLFVDESVPDAITERAGDVLYSLFS